MTTDEPPSGPAALEWSALADLASGLATEAGGIALDLATQARSDTSTKSSSADLVTIADRSAEDLIVAGLLGARPHDAIEGEEGTSRPGTSGVVWHIDPIDGTTNYVFDIPAYAVSIAAEVDGDVVAGVVFDPAGSILYRAVKGQGATRNGDALSCSTRDELETALVATGFSYLADRRKRQAEILVDVLPRVRDIRRFGSAALDLCAVATGQVDGYYERGLNQWDLAAGALVATEAGAIVENLRGGKPDGSFVLAAGPGLFRLIQSVLAALSADSDDAEAAEPTIV